MAFQYVMKKESVMKFVSFILIILIPMMGFPLLTSAAAIPADSSRTADITKQKGRWLTIDKGWVHGVGKGMTGIIRFSYGSGGAASYYSRGLFEVRNVYERTARVYVTKIPGGTDLTKAVQVLFRDDLTPRDISKYPFRKSEPESPGIYTTIKTTKKAKPSVERYLNFQTIEYSGSGEQFRAVSSYATTVEKRILNDIGKADYKLWANGQTIINDNNYRRKFNYGPLEFRRNLSDDKIAFKTKGFKLTQEVLNQTIGQVRKGHWGKDYWQELVRLDLVGDIFPTYLTFHFKAYPFDYNTPKPTFIIKYASNQFNFKALSENPGPSEEASGRIIGVIVYSPGDDRLYQVTSVFESQLNSEYLNMEECSYLVDSNGKKVLHLLDLRRELNLTREPLQIREATTLPLWAMQATMVQRASCLSGLCAAEMGTNPDVQTSTPGELITKAAVGIPTNQRFHIAMSSELTAELLKQGKPEGEAERWAAAETASYNAVPQQSKNPTFPGMVDPYFRSLMKQYQLSSLTSSIKDVFAQAAKPSFHTTNINIVDCPPLGNVGNQTPSVPSSQSLAQSNVQPTQQLNSNGAKGSTGESQGSKGEGSEKAKTDKAQKAKKQDAKRAKESNRTKSPTKSSGGSTSGAATATTTSTTAVGGGLKLGTVALGVVSAGAAVYGGLELVKALAETDITGEWNFHLNMGQYGSASGPITLRGNKDSGTVDWGDGYTGPYWVDGDRITMRLNISVSVVDCNMRIDVNISGIIKNNNSMNGSLSDSASITCPDIGTYAITLYGSWSATR
jgi:hypothetical protein